MTPADALRTHLLANEAVAALVSDVWKMRLPQGTTLPALFFQRVGGEIWEHQGAAAGVASARYQLSCCAATYGAARSLADAVREALDGYRGTMGGDGGVTVLRVHHLGDFDDFVQSPDGRDAGVYMIPVDFEIQFRQSVPTF